MVTVSDQGKLSRVKTEIYQHLSNDWLLFAGLMVIYFLSLSL